MKELKDMKGRKDKHIDIRLSKEQKESIEKYVEMYKKNGNKSEFIITAIDYFVYNQIQRIEYSTYNNQEIIIPKPDLKAEKTLNSATSLFNRQNNTNIINEQNDTKRAIHFQNPEYEEFSPKPYIDFKYKNVFKIRTTNNYLDIWEDGKYRAKNPLYRHEGLIIERWKETFYLIRVLEDYDYMYETYFIKIDKAIELATKSENIELLEKLIEMKDNEYKNKLLLENKNEIKNNVALLKEEYDTPQFFSEKALKKLTEEEKNEIRDNEIKRQEALMPM